MKKLDWQSENVRSRISRNGSANHADMSDLRSKVLKERQDKSNDTSLERSERNHIRSEIKKLTNTHKLKLQTVPKDAEGIKELEIRISRLRKSAGLRPRRLGQQSISNSRPHAPKRLRKIKKSVS